jgi:putative ABC transport system permease protein
MTVKQGLKLVALGLLIGLASAFLLTRVMASLLFGISATDPATFASICVELLFVATLASLHPGAACIKSRCDDRPPNAVDND